MGQRRTGWEEGEDMGLVTLTPDQCPAEWTLGLSPERGWSELLALLSPLVRHMALAMSAVEQR